MDSVDYVGIDTSIALDSNDYPQISYYNATGGDLKFANWTGSKWNIETIDAGDNVGSYTSIALDSNGGIHISYYNITGKDLKYVTTVPEFPELILPILILMIFIAIFRTKKTKSKGVKKE